MLEGRVRNALRYVRGALLTLYLRAHGCVVGRRLKCLQWPYFPDVPRGNISIGDFVTIGPRVTIGVSASARLDIGDRVHLGQDIVISAVQNVSIGEHSAFAEFVSIRDGEHVYTAEEEHMRAHVTADPIVIGRYVAVNRGCTILRGARIADYAVIGANATVARGTQTVERGIYFGTPLRLIGKRRPLEALRPDAGRDASLPSDTTPGSTT
jgi:acetyltransferase-like isoleucine patch superfamily enzyme